MVEVHTTRSTTTTATWNVNENERTFKHIDAVDKTRGEFTNVDHSTPFDTNANESQFPFGDDAEVEAIRQQRKADAMAECTMREDEAERTTREANAEAERAVREPEAKHQREAEREKRAQQELQTLEEMPVLTRYEYYAQRRMNEFNDGEAIQIVQSALRVPLSAGPRYLHCWEP